MKVTPVFLSILGLVLVSIVVLSGGVSAQTDAPIGYERFPLGFSSVGYHPYLFVNETNILAVDANSSEVKVLESLDGGETWTKHSVCTTTCNYADFDFDAPYISRSPEGRVVVSWSSFGNLITFFWSDDLTTWTKEEVAVPVVDAARQAVFATSNSNWRAMLLTNALGAAQNIRLIEFSTADAGQNWVTDADSVLASSRDFSQDHILHFVGSADKMVACAAHEPVSGTTGTVSCWTRTNTPGGNSSHTFFNHDTSLGNANINLGVGNNGELIVYAGSQETGSSIWAKECIGVGCGGWTNLNIDPIAMGSVSPVGLIPGVNGQWDPDNSALFFTYAAGEWSSGGAGSLGNLRFQSTFNIDAASTDEEDLTNIVSGDKACYAKVSPGNAPTFTCSGFFYKAEAIKFDLPGSGFVTSANITDVAIDYSPEISFGGVLTQANAVFGNNTVQARDRNLANPLLIATCEDVEMRTLVDFTNQGVTIAADGYYLWYCEDPVTGVDHIARRLNEFDTIRVTPLTTTNMCRIEALDADNTVGLACNGSYGYYADAQARIVHSQKSFTSATDIDVDRTNTGRWVVGDSAGLHVFLKDGSTVFQKSGQTPECVAIHGRVLSIDGLTARQYDTEGSLIGSFNIPLSCKHAIYSKDGVYIYVLDNERLSIYDLNGTFLGKTQGFNPSLSIVTTTFDVDLLNNRAWMLINGSSESSTVQIFDIYTVTESLAGSGGTGENPPLSALLNPYASFTGAVAEFDDGIGGGAGTIFGDTALLDNAFGTSGAGAFFIGILLVLLLGAGVYVETKSTVLGLIAALLGFGFAVFLGFIPAWVPVFGAFALAAAIIHRRGSD